MKARDIPNALCIMRMVLTVPVAWSILNGRYEFALALFFVAGLTDGLDGFLAKRFSWESRLGGLLDPAADKLLLVTSFITLWLAGYVPAWLLTAVILRDVLIVLGAAIYQWRVGEFVAVPSLISKLNSVLQLLYVLLILSWLVFSAPGPGLIGVLGWIVLTTTLVSGVDYAIRWSGQMRTAVT